MKRLLPLLPLALLLSGCAIQVPPQGGDRDITPPRLLSAVPPDGSVGFTGHSFEFEFDENIQLKDLSTKLVVSPPLSSAPIARVRKNRLLLEFDDTLRASTTYCFNFGDAVVDLNEGNPLKDFRQVVSTGTFIDSLTIRGSVTRSEDLKPEKSMLVMLYPIESNDSAPYTRLPSYFARTGENGRFVVTNIAAGKYRIFGLSETNQDYLYNDPTERIAFLDTGVAAADSSVRLYSFAKQPAAALIKSSAVGPGKILFVFNRPDPVAKVRWSEQADALGIPFVWRSHNQDSLIVWYTHLDADTARFLVDYTDRTDTLDITLSRFDSEKKSSSFQLQVNPVTESGGGLAPNLPLAFRSNYPVTAVDRNKLQLMLDSSEVASESVIQVDSDRLAFSMQVPWQEEKSYRLLVSPGAFTDLFGHTNDTIETSINVKTVTDYGAAKIAFKNTDWSTSKILQLVDEKERVYRSVSIANDTILYFDFISPGTYRLKCIEDTDENGRWDAGDDLLHRMPERVRYYRDQMPVRANWDVEVKWELTAD